MSTLSTPSFPHLPEQLASGELMVNDEVNTEHISRLGQAMRAVKHASQVAIIATEVSPLNEALRISAFGATEVYSHNPLLGALAYGGSTLMIEGSAAVAAASAITSRRAEKSTTWINEKLNRTKKGDVKMGPAAEAGIALLGGSVVAMAAKQVENPTATTKEARRYGLKTTGWLAGVCAVQGALMSQGIETMDPAVLGVAALSVGGILAGANWAKNRPFNKAQKAELQELGANNSSIYSIDRKHGFVAKNTQLGTEEANDALELEREVWKKFAFGDAVDEYKEYDDQTNMFIARDDKEVLGVVRMFEGGPKPPPFMTMEFNDEKEYEQLQTDCKEGLVEEVGTAAKKEGTPKGVISAAMWRLAYRDARNRGVQKWGIIMEPERVEEMNERFGFCFKQMGPAVDYQGGECAPHVMDLQDVYDYMKIHKPHIFWWFTQKKLKH